MFNGLHGICGAGIIQNGIARENLMHPAMLKQPRLCDALLAYQKTCIIGPDERGEHPKSNKNSAQHGSCFLISFCDIQDGIFADA